MDQRTATTTDTVATITLGPDMASNFVEGGTKLMSAQLRIKPGGPVFTNTWRTFVDQVQWDVSA